MNANSSGKHSFGFFKKEFEFSFNNFENLLYSDCRPGFNLIDHYDISAYYLGVNCLASANLFGGTQKELIV